MTTLRSVFILIILAVLRVSWADDPEYDFPIFEEKIDGECLSKLSTLEHPPPDKIEISGLTLESFIAMVEKVEAIHRDWDIYQVSRALLKRFAFEEMVYQGVGSRGGWVQEPFFKYRWEVMAKLLGDDTKTHVFEEDDLSPEEKCTMFFMMGHTVNSTFRPGVDDDTSFYFAPIDGSEPGQADPGPEMKVVNHPREQGVVNIKGSSFQAVAISKVLNALLASHRSNAQSKSIQELYNINPDKIPKEQTINPLLGVTFGDVISAAFLQKDKEDYGNGAKFFGGGGKWKSTACPTEFILSENRNEITNALLRGAADGLLISRAVGSLIDHTNDLQLSRVLRMYYSPKGVTDLTNNEERGVSYCRRRQAVGLVGKEAVFKSALAYCHVMTIKKHSRSTCTDETVSKVVDKLDAAFAEMEDDTGTEECKGHEQDVLEHKEHPTCETPSNVFVVLDASEQYSTGITEQEEIVGYLASRLDFGRGVGSINVYIDGKEEDGKELAAVTFNNTNPTCAACDTARLDRKDFPKRAETEVVVLDGLNKTLRAFEVVYGLDPGVPSKVVVLFHYEKIKEKNKRRLQGSRNILRDGHRDTRMFVVTSSDYNKEEFSDLIENTTNIFPSNRNTEEMAKALIKRICRVPAVFQFNNCYNHKKDTRKENENIYTGYVSHNHVQFWAFYPEYFLKSYNIKIKFTAENGDITVCDGRGVENPGYSGDNFIGEGCKTTEPNSKELEFTYSNPCEGYHVHNCPPINFAIVGDTKNRANFDCPVEDDKCRRIDQAKFKMSHEGVFCSGADLAKSSMSMILVASLVFLLRRFLN